MYEYFLHSYVRYASVSLSLLYNVYNIRHKNIQCRCRLQVKYKTRQRKLACFVVKSVSFAHTCCVFSRPFTTEKKQKKMKREKKTNLKTYLRTCTHASSFPACVSSFCARQRKERIERAIARALFVRPMFLTLH